MQRQAVAKVRRAVEALPADFRVVIVLCELEALPFAVRCRDCGEAYEIGARRSRQLAHRRTGSFDWIDATAHDE